MTKPLSPTAAAVMSAYYCDAPLTGRERVAAALRAAAQFNPGPFVPELFGEGWKAAMDELEYIAAELEANAQ